MKAVIASLFAASFFLAGMPVHAAGVVGNSVTVGATGATDIASDEDKKSDDEKSTDDKKSDEEKKTDDEKKSD